MLIFCDLWVLGCLSPISPKISLLEQAQLKHVMLYAARTAVVPVGHSKLGAAPFPYWAPLDRPYTLVVDEQADPATASPFRADGTVLLAPVTSAPARPVAAQAGQPGAVAE
ncbi:hypothetical protein GCM10010317_021150 [Streptomyces mirabilis]|nr:hypothetical protein GCM10010317_021150 [Streptomyces mirabilis]